MCNGTPFTVEDFASSGDRTRSARSVGQRFTHPLSYRGSYFFWNVLLSDCLTHFILDTSKGVLAKSADPDQMPHHVASDLGIHFFASCFAIFQQKYLKHNIFCKVFCHFPTNISQHNLTPLKLKMDSSNIYGRRVLLV